MDKEKPSKEDLKIQNMHLLQVNQEGDSKMSSSRKTSNRTKKNAEKELFKNLYIDLNLDRTPQNINKNKDFDNLNKIISQKNSIIDKNKGSLYLKQQQQKQQQQQRRSISITGSGSGTHFSQRKTLEPQKSGFNFSQYAQYIDDELITQIQETKANQHKNFIQQFQKQKGEMPRISVDFIDLNNALKIEDLKLTLPLNQYVLKQEVSLKDETDRN
ncbi:hypothetical protein PPERSA_07509 [Pseudocohnilembus persalinus]|uniref:Uncharacterized protein n=1 Tax=Pseudocohnilembus persalinus TaxID=266149 RepID=A0A0V0QZM7_PSEPJ|nr:hypothetical protein PPERSA_07509 [Pseudocohnilembus persalinus]|eukprot:KRX07759.1 hypothetical protein PPERSA_07509 [Pseudocohnilembus persalinus]